MRQCLGINDGSWKNDSRTVWPNGNANETSPVHDKQQAGICSYVVRGNRCLIRADPSLLSVRQFDLQPITPAARHSKFNSRAESSIELCFVRCCVPLTHNNVIRNEDADRVR